MVEVVETVVVVRSSSRRASDGYAAGSVPHVSPAVAFSRAEDSTVVPRAGAVWVARGPAGEVRLHHRVVPDPPDRGDHVKHLDKELITSPRGQSQ